VKAGWKLVKLGAVLSKTAENVEADATTEYSEVTVKLWGKGVIERRRVLGSEITGRRFVARSGNFIVSRIDARNGAMGLIPASLDGGLVTNDFPLFEANSDRLELAYLGWLCRTQSFVDLCIGASEGSTNRVRLKEDRFLSLEIPLPPLVEQRRIVARIEALAGEIEEARRLRREASDETEAIMGRHVSCLFESRSQGKLPPAGTRGGFSKSTPENPDFEAPFDKAVKSARWEWKQIGQISELINGDRGANYPNKAEYVSEGVPWINTGHIRPGGSLSISSMHFITREKFDTLRSGKIRYGDLVYCLRGATIGKTAVITQFNEGAVASSLVIIRLGTEIDPWFAYRFLVSPLGQQQIIRFDNGSAQPNLSADSVKRFWLPVPPLPEQHRIVAELAALQAEVDALKRLQAEIAAELDALLPAILDRAFKGELD